ncbi:MAG: C69 family dipeptidase [Bacteroidales bacterium]|nr:C69 family dipeptidase [Bacteroidales bacterium]
MNRTHTLLTLLAGAVFASAGVSAQTQADFNDECTTITVGKKASDDGSVRTSHTDDSHRSRTNISVVPAQDHAKGDSVTMMWRRWAKAGSTRMPSYEDIPIGRIPQVAHTYQYFNTAYPCLNEHQLAIGESTIGGRASLKSDSGLIECQTLCMLLMQRCSTARDAIRTADTLTKKYGWRDAGECLTIADRNEVWHLEIYGPGKGRRGALWVAQRVPDDHIAVNANASTIKEIDPNDSNYFLCSENIYQLALDSGWWKEGEPFRFCYVYAPESRQLIAARRREWRVFDLLAPSLKLDPNMENYPFSVKPDTLVSMQAMMRVFRDFYEGTPYDLRKNITVAGKEGKMVISPLANPFMGVDELKLHKVNGGWHQYGERCIAVRFTVYGTIIQCRDWLPDAIGGLLWFALDNVASSVYVPLYAGITDLPETYKTDARLTGFSRDAAWWGFNRVGTLAMQRWGDMHRDIDSVWQPFEKELLRNQPFIEKEALDLYRKSPKKAIARLTQYSGSCCTKAVDAAWKLGNDIWTRYDELW